MSKPFTEQCFDAKSMLKLTEANVEAIRQECRARDRQGFVRMGEVSLDGIDVFTGFKSRLGGGSAIGRWAREAIVADNVMSKFPETINSFPMFTLPITNGTDHWRGLGLLTEDFTQNGKRILQEYHNRYSTFGVDRKDIESELELKVYDALRGSVYKEAFQHMAGFVFDKEVMVDFDDIGFHSSDELAEYESIAVDLVLAIPELV